MADALGWCLIVLGTIAVLLAEYAVAVAIFSWLNRLVVEPWRVRAAQDETWAGAVTFVRDMAKAISGVTPHLPDRGLVERNKARVEVLELCADEMERAAVSARLSRSASSQAETTKGGE